MQSDKNQLIENMLEGMAQIAYGHSRKDSFDQGKCVKCGEPAEDFRDEISAREYGISGLCQKCQDEFFVEENAK